MARIVKHSRNFVLGVAFVCVMAGTGGLLGAIGGVVLVLLTQSVLGVASSLWLFMPATTGIGALAAMLLGIALVYGKSPSLSLQPSGVATGKVEAK